MVTLLIRMDVLTLVVASLHLVHNSNVSELVHMDTRLMNVDAPHVLANQSHHVHKDVVSSIAQLDIKLTLMVV